MTYVTNTVKGTVALSDFDRGLAGKIFADVRENGAKMVMRGNIAECVLLSPEEYDRITEELEDAQLFPRQTQPVFHSFYLENAGLTVPPIPTVSPWRKAQVTRVTSSTNPRSFGVAL